MDKLKIFVTQFYTSNVEYGHYSEEINRAYCEKHGYGYYVEKNDQKILDTLNFPERSHTWYKPKLVLDVIEKFNPEYIMFLDIDACVVNVAQEIESYIDQQYDIIFTEDYGHHSNMNAGVFIIKNTNWSKALLNLWWNIADFLMGVDIPEINTMEEYNKISGYFKSGLWHDQSCISFLYRHLPSVNEKIKIIPHHDLNWRELDNSSFIYHGFAHGNEPYRKLDIAHNKMFAPTNDTNLTLSEISKKYPTDKDFTHNYYNEVYEKYFSSLRHSTKLFCEIGIGGFSGELGWQYGNSLKVVRDYFPNAHILGLDIEQKEVNDLNRIGIEYIDQSSREQLKTFAPKLSGYDIILDDGSHNIHDQQITFAEFFKELRSGGLYIIEDLHTSIEVNYPDKVAIWKWGSSGHITTLQMLNRFNITGEIISDYLTDEEKLYLQENIKSIEIFHVAPTSITSIIIKK
jgi:hypothetical protein